MSTLLSSEPRASSTKSPKKIIPPGKAPAKPLANSKEIRRKEQGTHFQGPSASCKVSARCRSDLSAMARSFCSGRLSLGEPYFGAVRTEVAKRTGLPIRIADGGYATAYIPRLQIKKCRCISVSLVYWVVGFPRFLPLQATFLGSAALLRVTMPCMSLFRHSFAPAPGCCRP